MSVHDRLHLTFIFLPIALVSYDIAKCDYAKTEDTTCVWRQVTCLNSNTDWI